MNISILGCGWLGLPAGKVWAGAGHRVFGSTTNRDKLNDLEKNDIHPVHLRLTESGVQGDVPDRFWESDVLLLNIPPGRSRGDVRKRHPREIEELCRHLDSKGAVRHLIFASSTSVYGPTGGWKREEDAGRESASSSSGEALLECEAMLLDLPSRTTTIIRFGGLYGYDRHPARNLAGRTGLKGGEKPVNLIHRDDAIKILSQFIERGTGGIFNAVSDEHPSRQEFYRSMANRMGIEPPGFLEDTPPPEGYKIISNRKLKLELGYEFIYPDPGMVAP